MTDTHRHLIDFANEAWGTRPEFPWADSGDTSSVLRHARTHKWYAVLMQVRASKLGMDSDEVIEVVNVKCDPETLGTLIGSEGFYPAYHMNKKHWMTVLLDGSVPCEMIEELLHISYALVS